MPIPVLKRHGVISENGDLVSLEHSSLKFEQSVKVQALCNRRITQILSARAHLA